MVEFLEESHGTDPVGDDDDGDDDGDGDDDQDDGGDDDGDRMEMVTG